MSFNIWHQGSHGGIGVVVDRIRASGANVVALSETGGGATEAIADALGWQHTEPGRSPITPTGTRTFGGGDGWPSDHLAVVSSFTV
ncbi:endonuclease/exonuclease/phosphatase family protein [Amycolatopsis lurida]